ncbi:MAG: glycosyltransferase, partial [Peptostreptococcaceae bacterium]
MQIQILISTMNRQSISELKLGEKNIFKDCIIINQITKDNLKLVNEELKDEKIKMISYREKGLSKSRNRALENSTGDILLLTDDDISFFDQSFEIIKKK